MSFGVSISLNFGIEIVQFISKHALIHNLARVAYRLQGYLVSIYTDHAVVLAGVEAFDVTTYCAGASVPPFPKGRWVDALSP